MSLRQANEKQTVKPVFMAQIIKAYYRCNEKINYEGKNNEIQFRPVQLGYN